MSLFNTSPNPYTSPDYILYKKCLRTISSCTTLCQMKVASTYMSLCARRMKDQRLFDRLTTCYVIKRKDVMDKRFKKRK